MERTATLVLTDPTGTKEVNIGHATPLSFSPDGASLLVATPKAYQLTTLSGEVIREVTGLPEVQAPPRVLFSKDRSYVAIREGTGPVSLYYLDWSKGSATKLNQFEIQDGQSYGFGPAGLFLVASGEKIASYALAPDAASASKTYTVPGFPSNAEIIGYEK